MAISRRTSHNPVILHAVPTVHLRCPCRPKSPRRRRTVPALVYSFLIQMKRADGEAVLFEGACVVAKPDAAQPA